MTSAESFNAALVLAYFCVFNQEKSATYFTWHDFLPVLAMARGLLHSRLQVE
jgi:hypothetical protein